MSKCGCKIKPMPLKRAYSNLPAKVELSIHYCPKHANVDEMVELLKEILRHNTHYKIGPWETNHQMKALLDRIEE